MRRLTVFILFGLSVYHARAQHNPYEYFLSGTSSQQLESRELSPEASLFYVPIEGGADVFTSMSEFNFSAVRYSRRGFDLPLDKYYFGNIELSGDLSGRTDYGLLGVIRRSRLPRTVSGGSALTGKAIGSAGNAEFYPADASLIAPAMRVTLSGYNRNGWGGIAFSRAAGHRNISYQAGISVRGGRDANIEGVNSFDVSLSGLMTYKPDERQKLSLFLLADMKERGLRSSATREAFELTGDNYYNPSWGYFNTDSGRKVRNSRTSFRNSILLGLEYSRKLSDRTTLDASAAFSGKRNEYTSPAWYSAATPYPDYYRYMPSYADNGTTADYLRELWRAGDPAVTQFDWNTLYETNRFAAGIPVEEGGGRYILENRVSASNGIQVVVAATTRVDDASGLVYGLRSRWETMNFHKVAEDMLGAQPFLDVDQYLGDTVRYGGRWLNDLRDPERLVEEGKEFGYNYDIIMEKAELYGIYNYSANRVRVSLAGELGRTSLHRKGNYEKEINPGSGSYGKSRGLDFDTWSAKLTAGYSFSPRHIVRMTGMAAALAPYYGSVFVAPEHADLTTDDPRTVGLLSAEGEYTATLKGVVFKLAGFYTTTSREAEVYSYYDDIRAVYSDMAVSDISKRFYGVELGMLIELSQRFSLSVAATAGDYTYTSDPDVDIYDDALLKRDITGSKSYLRGYRIGNTPQTAASAELAYDMYGFRASLSFNYMAGRYVEANPLRRMARAYDLEGSPERFTQFVAQEKLPDASTVDLFIMKSFEVGAGSLTLLASVNNLLNDTDIIYSGYEQMRIMRRGSGLNRHYEPFPSKYLYSYPRSFYVSATYRF